MNTLSLKRKRVMTYFIEATESIIESEGVSGVSINKVANLAGYNSATIYNYFDSIEHLILYASMNCLKAYIKDLNDYIDEQNDNALEVYRKIYTVFNKHSFKKPEVFYNMFFGKYSNYLDEIIAKYLEIFPHYLDGSGEAIRTMLSQGKIFERDKLLINHLARDGFIKADNKERVLQVIIRLQQSYMYNALIEADAFDFEKSNREFFLNFDYIIEKS